MLILVTGAASALGTAVTSHFMRAGHRVRGLVRTLDYPAPNSTEIIRGDITDQAVVAAAARDVEVAVHCAASHASDLADSRRVNVTGTQFLCEALLASSRDPLLVNISTISVYDDAAGPDFDEDSRRLISMKA
jgi:nucleoside-diphosphate-sugar epimerase